MKISEETFWNEYKPVKNEFEEDVAKDHIRFFRTQTAGTLTQQKAYEFHFRKQHGVREVIRPEDLRAIGNPVH